MILLGGNAFERFCFALFLVEHVDNASTYDHFRPTYKTLLLKSSLDLWGSLLPTCLGGSNLAQPHTRQVPCLWYSLHPTSIQFYVLHEKIFKNYYWEMRSVDGLLFSTPSFFPLFLSSALTLGSQTQGYLFHAEFPV